MTLAAWLAGSIVLIAIALAAAERSGLLAPGAAAPDFSATLNTGEHFSLSGYRGKNPVVLFFYPADFTSGCTKEACAFRDNYQDLEQEGAVIIGISRNDPSSHQKFSDAYHLPYPLISDTDRSIIKAYGVQRLGGLVDIPRRVTYVIDKDGIIRAVIHHEFMINRQVDDVRSALHRLAAQ